MSLEGNIAVQLGDKEYQVSRLTQEIQDKYGEWVEQQCLKVLRHSRAAMNDAEYNHLLSEHQRMKRHGEFELLPGSESMAHLTRTVDGYRHFMFLCFRKCQGITEAEVGKLMDDNEEEFKRLFLEIMSTKKAWLGKGGGGCSLPG